MSKNNYIVGDPKIDKLIQELVDLCEANPGNRFLREIITTAVKLGMEHKDLGDYKLINTTLKELRHAFRIFLPYRQNRKVIVFGSARTKESDPCYKMAQELCETLIQHSFMVITGAGGGIMEAGNRGAGKENSFGINIKLPLEQKANPYIKGDPKLMNFKYFFTRKLIFIKESDATVLFPGGLGTQDEGFENLTLFQTGKSMPRPIILAEPKNGHYWKNWIQYLKTSLLGNEYISPSDFSLFHHVYSIDEAVDYINQFYRIYHSLRYVGDLTVLRLQKEVPQPLLESLNVKFKDILYEGSFENSPPLEPELRRNECLDLKRLVFKFNKRDFGRLNELIHTLNQSIP